MRGSGPGLVSTPSQPISVHPSSMTEGTSGPMGVHPHALTAFLSQWNQMPFGDSSILNSAFLYLETKRMLS